MLDNFIGFMHTHAQILEAYYIVPWQQLLKPSQQTMQCFGKEKKLCRRTCVGSCHHHGHVIGLGAGIHKVHNLRAGEAHQLSKLAVVTRRQKAGPVAAAEGMTSPLKNLR